MSVVFIICGVILTVAGVLTVIRMTAGPTVLDRTIALDVMIAIGICAIAVEAAQGRHTDTLAVLLVLSLVGFVGSVSVARFAKGSDDVEAEESDGQDGARL